MNGGQEARRSWGNEAAIGQPTRVKPSPSAQEITRGRCFLRHTAGTLGYLRAVHLQAVQNFLGHADPRMTSKYAHVVDMAQKNPALLIPGEGGKGRVGTHLRPCGSQRLRLKAGSSRAVGIYAQPKGRKRVKSWRPRSRPLSKHKLQSVSGGGHVDR